MKQISLFKKNKMDYTLSEVVATASQGNQFAPFVLNRNNDTFWMTSGSVDADGTTLTVDMVNTKTIDTIFLVLHNFKAFTVKYWDGAAYQAFSPAINETTNTDSVSKFSVTSVTTSKLQITITGTQVANADKQLAQFIATQLVGQLAAWPIIKNPLISRNKRITTMLSGKRFISENVGAFSCDLEVANWSSSADLTIVEALYASFDGVLVWLCGGDQTQFSSVRQGYRLQDIFLMKTTNDYAPEFVDGLYKTGLTLSIALAEVTT